MSRPAITEVGRNCWRRSHADRLSLLVDAESYYRTLKSALRLARSSILVIGWEFDSRIRLERTPDAEEPNTIGGLLDHVVRRTPTLRAHVLIWNSALVYAFGREMFTQFKMQHLTHRRLLFRFDDSHPLGASHHQKIVVIDDALAFVGGLDIGDGRWDSRDHLPDDPRRSDPILATYPPFHDVMMMVSGPVAADLGDLARQRWRSATGQKLAPPRLDNAPWPPGVEPGLRDVPLSIARTSPAWEGEPAAREVEALYLDMIAAAERFIYIECQYFASRRIGQALATRLQREPAPDVLAVSSSDPAALIERAAMGASRARLYQKLSSLDSRNRLRLVYPVSGKSTDIKIHSKLMIVDDELLRVGSANLNNRSFGLDTECDLLLEAQENPQIRDFIRSFRLDLMAEHLGTAPADVAAAERAGGLLNAVETLSGGSRSLVPLGPESGDGWSKLMPAGDLFDPERPVESIILEADVAGAGRRTLHRQIWWATGLLAAIILFALAWDWAPLSHVFDAAAIAAVAEPLRSSPHGLWVAIATFLVGSLVGVPAIALIALNGAVFGFIWGFVYSLLGATLSAAILYDLGRRLGRDRVRRLAGRRVTKVNRSMVRSGILVTATMRLVPVATFPVVSLVAGSARLRPHHYLIGTLIGMLPVTAAFSLLGDRLAAMLHTPDVANVALLALLSVGVIIGGASLILRLARAAPASLEDNS